MAHRRNVATEDELDARARQQPVQSADDCAARLRTHIGRFDGRFPLDPDLRYLDIGCGNGEVTVAMAMMGCKNVTGVDFVPRNIAEATSLASRLGVGDGVHFIVADINDWAPLEKYDVLLSFDAFEHIENPRHFLAKMADLIAPGGVAVLGFGPLFHSPFGDHMSAFFRIRIPWRGVLFSEKAMLRVRREFFRPTETAECYQDIVGGLNLMRYSEFLEYVRDTGWDFNYLRPNPRLKSVPVVRHLSAALASVPVIRDYFVFSVYAILRRPAVART